MLRSIGLAAVLAASTALATTTCSLGSPCPESAPCCSQYGECGVGAYCLGGCDPRMSFSLDSCVPAPVCESRVMTMDSLDSVVDIGDYLGDASKADWVSQGEPLVYDDTVLLTMPKNSVGTVLSSTVYLWYGNVKGTFKTSRTQGVITAFILFSDVKDEIDLEFVGADLEVAETNFFFQGMTVDDSPGNISVTDTFENYHTYEIHWTPDVIEWYVDGKLGQSREKKDYWNETTQNWDFPQTPARLQLSIWPGGLASNAQGTIDWAGGEINWDAPDIKNNGYFYATVKEVEIECYNATSPPGTNTGKSYYYDGMAGTNNTVVNGNNNTVLASLEGTGTDMDAGASSAASSGTASSTSQATKAATVPGGSSDGSGSDDHSDGSSSGSSTGSSSSAKSSDTSNCDTSSFNQDCSSSSSSKDSNGKSESTRTSASALAIIIAGFAVAWL